jgi:hypothetical protein
MKENSFLAPDVNLQELGMYVRTMILIGIEYYPRVYTIIV